MVKQEPAKIAYRVGAIACAVAQTYMAIVLVEYSSLALEGIWTSAYLDNITSRLVLYGEHHRILWRTIRANLNIIAARLKIFWSAKSVLRTKNLKPIYIDALHRQWEKRQGRAPACNYRTLYLPKLSDHTNRWFRPAEASRVYFLGPSIVLTSLISL